MTRIIEKKKRSVLGLGVFIGTHSLHKERHRKRKPVPLHLPPTYDAVSKDVTIRPHNDHHQDKMPAHRGLEHRTLFSRVSLSLCTDLELVSSTPCSEKMSPPHCSAIHQASCYLQPEVSQPTDGLTQRVQCQQACEALSMLLALIDVG